MRHAHRAGLRTTATMMYGTVETEAERIEHLVRLRELQDETGGFTAFITWSYQPEHTELAGSEATGIDYLRTLAIARIVLDNFDNLQASWVTQGGKVGQLSLAYGANDMGSVMIEENVVRAAGASYCMDEVEIVRNIEDAGFAAKRRNMHYDILGEPIFRERDVPRMLELATARRDGDTTVPDELVNYPARSRAGKQIRVIPIDPLSRRLDPADRRAADPRRLARCRSRPRRRARIGRAARARRRRARSRSRRGRDAARPGQRAHAPRAVVSARRGAAGVAVRHLDSRRDGGAAAASRSARRRDPRRGRRALDEAVACGTAIVGDISNTLVTFEPLTRSSSRRWCSTS
jgi:hypothetical protein